MVMILSITAKCGGSDNTWRPCSKCVCYVLIINKQDIALPATRHIFVVPKEEFFLFKEENYFITNEPIHICAFQSTPHKHYFTFSFSFFVGGNKQWRILWRMASSMHDHAMTWKLCRSNDMNYHWPWTNFEIPQLIPSEITVSIKGQNGLPSHFGWNGRPFWRL